MRPPLPPPRRSPRRRRRRTPPYGSRRLRGASSTTRPRRRRLPGRRPSSPRDPRRGTRRRRRPSPGVRPPPGLVRSWSPASLPSGFVRRQRTTPVVRCHAGGGRGGKSSRPFAAPARIVLSGGLIRARTDAPRSDARPPAEVFEAQHEQIRATVCRSSASGSRPAAADTPRTRTSDRRPREHRWIASARTSRRPARSWRSTRRRAHRPEPPETAPSAFMLSTDGSDVRVGGRVHGALHVFVGHRCGRRPRRALRSICPGRTQVLGRRAPPWASGRVVPPLTSLRTAGRRNDTRRRGIRRATPGSPGRGGALPSRRPRCR